MRTAKQPVTAAQKAYIELKRRIIDGVLAEGAPIRQDEIAQAMGVSKIPVREALTRLESEGLVTLTPNAGATVAVLSVGDYVEMLDMRLALESRALELAIPNMASSDFDRARQLLREYDQAMTQQEWSDLNVRFHECLYAPADRPRLMAMTRAVQNQMGRIMRLRVTMAAEHSRSHAEHIQLLDACERGDKALAVSLLRAHIEQTQREVQGYFRHFTHA